jgi:hypothetical protein
MKKVLLSLILVLTIFLTPINIFSYEYTGGVPKEPTTPTSTDDNIEFKNDLSIFTVNSPNLGKTYYVGELISLSVTPQKYFFTVLPGGFTAEDPNDLKMTIKKDDVTVKTFTVSFGKDDVGKTYSDSFTPTKEGTYDINMTFRSTNYGNYQIKVANRSKKDNPIKVKGKTPKVSYSKLKKENQYIAVSKAMSITNAKGTLKFKKTSGSAKILVNSKTGKITVGKGLKKNTYKVKVAIIASGNDQYKGKTVYAIVNVKVA